jgi:hypothetical protein
MLIIWILAALTNAVTPALHSQSVEIVPVHQAHRTEEEVKETQLRSQDPHAHGDSYADLFLSLHLKFPDDLPGKKSQYYIHETGKC